MIAEKLQNSVNHLRELLQRDNGDLAHAAPIVLDSLEAEIERVRGLESRFLFIPEHGGFYGRTYESIAEATNGKN